MGNSALQGSYLRSHLSLALLGNEPNPIQSTLRNLMPSTIRLSINPTQSYMKTPASLASIQFKSIEMKPERAISRLAAYSPQTLKQLQGLDELLQNSDQRVSVDASEKNVFGEFIEATESNAGPLSHIALTPEGVTPRQLQEHDPVTYNRLTELNSILKANNQVVTADVSSKLPKIELSETEKEICKNSPELKDTFLKLRRTINNTANFFKQQLPDAMFSARHDLEEFQKKLLSIKPELREIEAIKFVCKIFNAKSPLINSDFEMAQSRILSDLSVVPAHEIPIIVQSPSEKDAPNKFTLDEISRVSLSEIKEGSLNDPTFFEKQHLASQIRACIDKL